MPNREQSEKRICFAVDTEKKDFLNDTLEWGDLKKVYSVLTDQLIELLKEYDPDIVKAGIVSRKISLKALVDFNKQTTGEQDATKGS